jgi:hypothetical protein
MSQGKKEIIESLKASVEDLKKDIDMHCCLVSSILEERVEDHKLRPLLDRCPKRSREIRLENAIKEAIDVLEESRKAFKSKRLEALRKRLTSVLINAR